MTGSSTPTRSCLKRRLQAAKNSISGSLSSGSSSAGSTSSRNSLCKTVSFDGKDNIFFCDPDYDRHSVPVAPKLSYEDILELKMLNVNMMCPQHRCAPVVPVGIMPLLPTSDSPPHSASSTSNPSSALFRPKQAPSPGHHHYGRHNFVNLLDDESSSMSSITPPPSSPSEHSPSMAPMPFIATDDEGQLIFSFSSPDDGIIDSQANTHSLNFATSSRRHKLHITSGSSADESEEEGEHVKPGIPHAVALSKKLSTIVEKKDVAAVEPPFPVPPSQPTLSHNHAALTLTPSFFTLPPPSPSSSSSSTPNSATDSSSCSPFPFAPPVPTTTGLSIQPAAAMVMTLPESLSGQNSKPEEDEVMSDASVHATTTTAATSPVSQALNHHRSTSSSASTIVPTNSNSSNPQSPQSPSSTSSTPHASPTLLMRSSKPTSASTPSLRQQIGQAPPVAGPLAALQHQPRSPQLSGLPSPSLIPPSPLSLYPPSLDLNNNNSNTPGAIPTGFFPEKKKGIAGSAVLGHVKRASGSALARPTSPVVKPLAS